MPPNPEFQKAVEEAKRAKLESPRNGSPSVAGPTRIIRVTTMPAVYKGFKQRVEKTDPNRNRHESRYQNGDLPGIDMDTITKNRALWDPLLDAADNRKDGKAIYNNDQPAMMWFSGTETATKISNLCMTTINKTENGLPCHGDEKNLLPVGIRPGDDYLGACWIHLPDNLHDWFSADVHPDGFPFGDRTGWGLPCKPRGRYFDYHDHNGTIRRDDRIGYIRLGSGADSQIVILGGSEFKITNISQEMYRNFHHFFIDITDRDAKQLRPVLEEPAEVKRRPKVDPDILPPSIRPAGARSVWEPCVQQLMNAISMPVPKRLQVAEIQQLMDTVPTRGYRLDTPSFEFLSHAMLAGAMHAAAFRNCVSVNRVSAGASDDTVKGLDKVMDFMVSAEQEDHADATSLIERIGEGLTRIRNEAAHAADMDRMFYSEIGRTMRGIPDAGCILEPLPLTVVPEIHRALVGFMRQAVFQLDWDTFIQEEAAPKRQDWRTSVVVEEDASEAAQPPFKLRGAPLEGEKASDGPLFDLLAEPRKVKLATSDVKTKEETSPASIRLKRKAEALLSPSDGLDRRSSRSVNGGGTIVWKFTDPGANLRVQNARACCILLGITRSNSWKDMAVRCEKEINSKQRFGEEAAKRYGKMLPGP